MITFETLKKKLNARLQKGEFKGKSVSLSGKPIKAGITLRMGPRSYTVFNDTFLVIIDEAPGAFWEHPVLYELHEIKTGKMIPIYEKRWLSNPDKYPALKLIYHPIPEKEKKDEKKKEEKITGPGPFTIKYVTPIPDTGKMHAVLFGGPGGNFQYDIANMRDVLMNKYAFTRGNIHILLDDGSDQFIPPNQAIKGCHTASREHLDNLLFSYSMGGKWELGEQDTLFLYIFSHGGSCDDTYYFATFALDHEGNEVDHFYHDFELAERLSNIACGQLIVVMNPCGGGGFIPKIIDKVSSSTHGPKKTVAMAGCRKDQLAWTLFLDREHFFEKKHGAFSVFFYTALNWGSFPPSIPGPLPGTTGGFNLTPDTNGDGMISMKDAWKWAKHIMRSHRITTLLGIEIPQYAEYPENAGADMFLGKPELQVKEFSLTGKVLHIFFTDPAVLPDDTTTLATGRYYRGFTYHTNAANLIVARVFNIGTAPCRDVTVEFRLRHEGDVLFIGVGRIAEIDTGTHAYAHVKWDAPSSLDISAVDRVMIRATCPADPAPPSRENDVGSERHQAQMSYVEATLTDLSAPFKQIENFGPVYAVIRNLAGFGVVAGQLKRYARHFPIDFDENKFEGADVGGLHGAISVESRSSEPDIVGMVTIESEKHPGFKLSVETDSKGQYLFEVLPVGKYKVRAESLQGIGEDLVELIKDKSIKKNLTVKKPGEAVKGKENKK